MDTKTRQSLKDRDRVNPYYIPELEGHQNPFLAATLPHIEVVLILSLVFAGGILGALAGKLLLGIGASVISGGLLTLAALVRLNDPAKRRRR
ncbi:hypothetical protein [Parvularcula marina]|uniref:Uncharacterized protein n=1 Tax=Parvularcula marina TaxID=2292771 RepID=A0A371RG11_9PROT|nr:hypothetical protein [Parvularcula marina]RFB04366.1 hypothetical protein DX908_03145 [Parvularcula marina]